MNIKIESGDFFNKINNKNDGPFFNKKSSLTVPNTGRNTKMSQASQIQNQTAIEGVIFNLDRDSNPTPKPSEDKNMGGK